MTTKKSQEVQGWDLEMQMFRQLSVPLDFGGTGTGFTITLTGPSYIVERLSPRTEPSGIEPLKP